MIPWRPIAELPDELKDGREVMVWDGHSADAAVWANERWWDEGPGWNETTEGGPISGVTHFAEITPPEPMTVTVPLASILPDDPMADIPA